MTYTALTTAIDSIYERHEILRKIVKFKNGEIVMENSPNGSPTFVLEELDNIKISEMDIFIEQNLLRALPTDRIGRISLIHFNSNHHAICVCLLHVMFDGRSSQIITNEILMHMSGCLDKRAINNNLRMSGDLDFDENYSDSFRNHCEVIDKKLNKTPEIITTCMGKISFLKMIQIEKKTSELVFKACKKNGITITSFLIDIFFSALLDLFHTIDTVQVCVPVDIRRYHQELKNSLGALVSFVDLVVDNKVGDVSKRFLNYELRKSLHENYSIHVMKTFPKDFVENIRSDEGYLSTFFKARKSILVSNIGNHEMFSFKNFELDSSFLSQSAAPFSCLNFFVTTVNRSLCISVQSCFLTKDEVAILSKSVYEKIMLTK